MGEAAGDLTALWREFAGSRDVGLRNQLVEAHLNLARTVAATLYRHRGSLKVEFGDYLQLATLGLIEAVDRFDVDRGVAFASFATMRVRGAVLNNLAGMSEQFQQLDLRRRLRQERIESLHRSPGGQPDLFASLVDMAVGLALSHLLEGSGMLQLPDEGGTTYQQHFYDSTRERQLRETLARLVEALPDQERRVLRYHYFQNVAFTEIGDLMGVSKGRVSQIHRHALQLLREARGGGQSLERDI
jgi:RNA polymerase sigma factor for flagellar operon FliA